MFGTTWPLLRTWLHGMDAERAHDMTLKALETLPLPAASKDDPALSVQAFGLDFPNPVGLAAGFDKDVRVPDAMLRLGFGFVEAGSLTPLPQPGNPKPRVFRLPLSEGVINRLGFNNGGHEEALARLRKRGAKPGILGINVGANKDSTDRADDYARGVRAFAPYAHYLTVNISSPNTPGLRDLQAKSALDDLLARALAVRDDVTPRKPVLLKLAPDLALGDLDDAVEVALRRGIDGLIVSNTTLARPDWVRDEAVREAGGLSGAPLLRRANWMLAQTALRVEGRVPLIGVGGITTPEAALSKIRAGASLIQLYSGLIFKGPTLVTQIKAGLSAALAAEGLTSLQSLVGRDVEAVAQEGPEG